MASPYSCLWRMGILALVLFQVQSSNPVRARAEGFTLDSCLARAVGGNPTLRAADRDVDAARARLRQAGALEAPSITYEVGKLGTRISSEEREAALRVSQDFPPLGARGRAIRAARADLGIAVSDRESFVLQLRGDVTRAYRRLQADEAGLRTLLSLRNTAADLEQMVSTRLRAGGARYLDVLRARSERVRIENDLIEAERGRREDRRTLNTLMARTLDSPLEPTDTLRFVALTDSLPAILDRARATRPRLRGARLAVERGEAQIAQTQAALRPAPSLSAGLDRVPGVDRPGFGGQVSLSLPFAPWTDRRARLGESRAAKGGAEARLEATERELEARLGNAYEAARSAEALVRQFDRFLLADASDAIRTAIQNYQTGQIDGLELFETLRTMRTIQLEHVRALLNHELALTDLAVAE